MNKVLIYHSRYGHTKKYAQWIGQQLGLSPIAYSDVTNDIIENSDIIIYGAPLYTGKFKTHPLIIKSSNKKLIFFIVGSTNPNDLNTDEIYKKSLPDKVIENANFFHFIAGFNYPKLSIIHKFMMKLIRPEFDKVPVEKRSPEYQRLLDNFFLGYDNSDKDSTLPLIEHINNIK